MLTVPVRGIHGYLPVCNWYMYMHTYNYIHTYRYMCMYIYICVYIDTYVYVYIFYSERCIYDIFIRLLWYRTDGAQLRGAADPPRAAQRPAGAAGGPMSGGPGSCARFGPYSRGLYIIANMMIPYSYNLIQYVYMYIHI